MLMMLDLPGCLPVCAVETVAADADDAGLVGVSAGVWRGKEYGAADTRCAGFDMCFWRVC